MKNKSLLLCIFATVILIPHFVTADLTFTIIAESNTPAPGGDEDAMFLGFNEPAIENGLIVFRGQDTSSDGLFFSQDGVTTRIVDSNTLIPGEEVTFPNFSGASQLASISNEQIAFLAGGSSGGVFTSNLNGSIESVVRSQDDVPGLDNQTFVGFANPIINNGTVVFRGAFGPFTSGIYVSENGNDPTTVVDSLDAQPIPGINQDFFSFTPRAFEGGRVMFIGGGFNNTTGIYETTLSGSISVVVDINTPIPDGVGTFTFFDNRFPNVDDGQVVFFGTGSNGQSGIYVADGNGLTKIVDRNTLQPGSTNPFTDLREPIIDDGRVFFQGSGTEGLAIHKFENGEITRLIGNGDQIDGRQVTIIQNVLDVDGNTMVFMALLDGRLAIVSANLSNPGDVNCDGAVNLLDVGPFVDALSNGIFNPAADINQDGMVNLLDVGPFIELLSDGA